MLKLGFCLLGHSYLPNCYAKLMAMVGTSPCTHPGLPGRRHPLALCLHNSLAKCSLASSTHQQSCYYLLTIMHKNCWSKPPTAWRLCRDLLKLLMVCFRLVNCRYVISLLVKQTFLLANYPICKS